MNKKIIYIVATLFLIGGILGYNYYQKIFGAAITTNSELYIYDTDSLVNVKEKIAEFSNKPNTFLWVAAKKNFSKPKTGRYLLKKGMSNNDLVNMLRSGNQTAVSVSFNNQDTLEKFASRIAEQLAIDSLEILTSFSDKKFLSEQMFTEKSVFQICIPNSYQFYWTVSADNFRDKLLSEYNRFWTSSRLEKAKVLNMSRNDVITLASIVQKETAKKVERPIVAGLYLNRLQNGWPLQADPTIIYCIKEIKGQDYVVKRVLKADLSLDSPYNTYQNRGLPPSQIAMPDISAIDAVLNAQKHDYYYMCADIDKIGYHQFAKTLAQHNRNAVKYQNWLNKKGVNR
ncbi:MULTISPECIES: endolytic transglycosylase MltG [unclassified Polaribacter]|uniref:endolytic transglycosylase MltG n=1 Tax=unclassified Polaribacter TaxID=196858 RepID=UPI0011BE6CB7|nr:MULTISPECIES: endolytic transglycosylase MltG [unclassified Polaribacter]TXD50528.1 endolytic transglycosylase MltG [Polaribacter sp. IC063]TXD59051.1 endolytic transglycosylase MltG [Polaribacter sp. IC066]